MNVLRYAFGSIALPPLPEISGITIYAVGIVIDPSYPSGIGSIAPALTLAIQ